MKIIKLAFLQASVLIFGALQSAVAFGQALTETVPDESPGANPGDTVERATALGSALGEIPVDVASAGAIMLLGVVAVMLVKYIMAVII